MTIEIEVKNKDSRKNAIVCVDVVASDAVELTPERSTELKGGESITEFVHSGQSLVVKEIQNG